MAEVSTGTNPEVLLVQPPFFRLFGSHNDRMPLELCYTSAHLTRLGVSNVVFNADWTGATRYIRWATLFKHYPFFRQAVDGHTPLISETVERVLSYGAQVVVLSAGDNTLPWVDLGNAYVAAAISNELRRYGTYTVGVGPFYSTVPDRFIDDFDAVVRGYAWTQVGHIAKHRPHNQVVKASASFAVDLLPTIDVRPGCIDDVLITAVGCPFQCDFCLARDLQYNKLAIGTVADDVARRRSHDIDISDSVFTTNRVWVEKLKPHMLSTGKRFACEIHANLVDARWLDLLAECGIGRVKMGLEVASDSALQRMSKRQTVAQVRNAARLARERGLQLVLYVLLGGPGFTMEDGWKTLDLCLELEASDYVVNTWAYHDLENRDFRYDCHFSEGLVKESNLEVLIQRFFELQSVEKKGLGYLL